MKLTETCVACPKQWEGYKDDGTFIYIRYRHGSFRIDEGEVGNAIHQEYIGHELAGSMEDDEFKALINKVIPEPIELKSYSTYMREELKQAMEKVKKK